jgi:hypothetical protein
MRAQCRPIQQFWPGRKLLWSILLVGSICTSVLAETVSAAAKSRTGLEAPRGALVSNASDRIQKPDHSNMYQGVVTWIDPDRQLVVLQDGERSMALRVDLPKLDFACGDWVVLEGKESPLIIALPNYPDKPDGSGISPLFEAATNWNSFFVTRMRGYLHPPTTGNYTFWIASDDSSELWLSADADAATAQKIAFVPTGRFTQPEEWNHLLSQKSRPVLLQAGGSYYIEAIQQDHGGNSSLAVAWQGPGIRQSVIGGAFLAPFVGSDDASAAAVAQNE